MNIVFLSPHFPPNYFPFCVHLKRMGANVLGVADAQLERMRPELKAALTEYYRVDDMKTTISWYEPWGILRTGMARSTGLIR